MIFSLVCLFALGQMEFERRIEEAKQEMDSDDANEYIEILEILDAKVIKHNKKCKARRCRQAQQLVMDTL